MLTAAFSYTDLYSGFQSPNIGPRTGNMHSCDVATNYHLNPLSEKINFCPVTGRNSFWAFPTGFSFQLRRMCLGQLCGVTIAAGRDRNSTPMLEENAQCMHLVNARQGDYSPNFGIWPLAK